jgi:hypothetical protein
MPIALLTFRTVLRWVPLSWGFMESGDHDYLAREARARMGIDKQLVAVGWVVQSQDALNLSAGPGGRGRHGEEPQRHR